MANDTKLFTHVEDGKIVRIRIRRPRSWGNTAFGEDATDDEYRAVGLWPHQDILKECDPLTERCSSPAVRLIPETQSSVGDCIVTAIPLEEIRAKKLYDLSEIRILKETQGVVVGGSAIRTDRPSQATISGAKVYSDMNPEVSVDWKGADGWVSLTNAEITTMAGAVGAHVQTCFSQEKTHHDAIVACGDVNEITAYDISTGWPE